MRRQLLWAAGVLVLLFAVDNVLAQGQGGDKGNAPRREAPPAPVRMQGRGAGRQVDPNEMAKREQIRQQMRERAGQRRLRADQNAVDVNTPGEKGRPELGGKGPGALRQKVVGSDQQHKQQLKAVEQQLAKELAKHRERVAKLTRIRELAQQQGDTETVGKVDKLLEQDRQRYEAKAQRMERRKNAIIEFQGKAAADKNKSGADADTNKP